MSKIDFSKEGGLVPAVVQDVQTNKVLMLGYMNEAAVEETQQSGKVTFFSRSKQRLWTKGETSKNYLEFVSMAVDCDRDALLIKANPQGPTCHTGADTCWNERNVSTDFHYHLEQAVQNSSDNTERERSVNSAAQQFGETAMKLVIEAKDDDEERLLREAANLICDYTRLLKAKGYSLLDIESVLQRQSFIKKHI